DALSLFARGDDGSWVLHARAGLDPTAISDSADLQAVLARCTPDEAGPEALYAMLDGRGIHLGPAFRGIRRLWRGTGEAVAEIELPAGLAEDAPELPIHPAALDACFQTLGATFSGTGSSGAFLPFAIERVAFTSRCTTRFHVHVRARSGSGTPDAAQGDLRLFDAHGHTIARIDGLSIARVRAEGGPGADESNWAYRVTWEPLSLTAAALSPSAAELAQAVNGVASSHVVAASEELGSGLEALAAAYAAEALTHVADPGAVDPKRRRLFAHLPKMAAVASVAGPAGSLRVQLAQRFGPVPEIAIAARCGEALPGVLRGTVDPLSVLFAGDQAGFLYGEAAFARLLNHMVLAAVEPVLGAADAARPARILEIGAGTGALFQTLRERVPAERWRYTFTDLSPSFLAQAAERFGADAATFTELDIEQDPTLQGFPAAGYDLVIAGNVLHATRDLATAVEHARRLLAPGGVLVLLEAARRRAWSDLVFGLTDGWWRFEDTTRRPDHPLLDGEGWRDLLAERFAEVEIVASPGQGDQIVALARHA
ncbi:MAG: polyketide synthase dehydratase domain-containing protein, partial [Geminicoccaceae bacterium]